MLEHERAELVGLDANEVGLEGVENPEGPLLLDRVAESEQTGPAAVEYDLEVVRPVVDEPLR